MVHQALAIAGRSALTGRAALAGRAAIVTGAATGIGTAIAVRLAADGARVVVNHLDSAGAAGDVVEAIRSAGGTAIAVHADVSRRDDLESLFAVSAEAFDGVDVIVNNAAVAITKPLAEFTDAEIDSVWP